MGQLSETQRVVLIVKVIKEILTVLNSFSLWSKADSLSNLQVRQSSVLRANCARVLGRKPLHQQHSLIRYQPRASNKGLLRSQPVDNASSIVKEWGDKWSSEKICFSRAAV